MWFTSRKTARSKRGIDVVIGAQPWCRELAIYDQAIRFNLNQPNGRVLECTIYRDTLQTLIDDYDLMTCRKFRNKWVDWLMKRNGKTSDDISYTDYQKLLDKIAAEFSSTMLEDLQDSIRMITSGKHYSTVQAFQAALTLAHEQRDKSERLIQTINSILYRSDKPEAKQ